MNINRKSDKNTGIGTLKEKEGTEKKVKEDKLKYIKEFENEIKPEDGINSEDEKKTYNRDTYDKTKR